MQTAGSKSKLGGVIVALAALLLLSSLGYFVYYQSQQKKASQVVEWSAIHISGVHKSGDAHLLKFPNNKFFLIDTGYREFGEKDLLPYLKQAGVEALEGILVTHGHLNHYGSLVDVLTAIPTKHVFFNRTDPELCLTEARGNRCNIEDIDKAQLETTRLSELKPADKGTVLYEDREADLTLSVIHYADRRDAEMFDGFSTEVKSYTVNDTSIVTKLQFGELSVLFPGDIGSFTGEYLTQAMPNLLKSDLIAAPHHGVTDLPFENFFEAVDPRAIIVSISPPPFKGARGQRVRDYASSNNRPLYITGYGGTIKTVLSRNSFKVVSGNQFGVPNAN